MQKRKASLATRTWRDVVLIQQNETMGEDSMRIRLWLGLLWTSVECDGLGNSCRGPRHILRPYQELL